MTDINKGNLTIGKYCSFARGCTIMLAGEHATNWVTTFHGFHALRLDFKEVREDISLSKGGVEIGHDVWCGNDTIILSGVKIGNGAIIGAQSVVRRDIPPYAIVLGNPARPTGYRFDHDTIAELEKIAWWNWPLDKIKKELPLLHSNKVEEFIERHKK
ncbi:MAG: CatB-related O-acetyltransferase [Smithella sp.]|nr:CatB-related O-acetyltransferase [Smithella sp.]